jgi:hypothetical protein
MGEVEMVDEGVGGLGGGQFVGEAQYDKYEEECHYRLVFGVHVDLEQILLVLNLHLPYHLFLHSISKPGNPPNQIDHPYPLFDFPNPPKQLLLNGFLFDHKQMTFPLIFIIKISRDY